MYGEAGGIESEEVGVSRLWVDRCDGVYEVGDLGMTKMNLELLSCQQSSVGRVAEVKGTYLDQNECDR